jgi:predicted MFS family arabinose efflux permease
MGKSSKHLSAFGAGKDLKLVYLAAFFAWLGFGIYVTTFNNFIVESVHMNAGQLGVLEFFRELPGVGMAFILALAMYIAEPMLASAGLLLIALGFLGYAGTNTYVPLVFFSLLWSVGLHCWMPLQSAMTISLAEEDHKGRRLGQVGGIGSLGTAIGILVVLSLRLAKVHVPYSAWYITTAVFFTAAALVIRFVRRDLSPTDKPRMVFKRKYLLYYILTFLDGCRKQVFITFAPFVLVKVFHAPMIHIAILMLINAIVNWIEAPVVGKIIDRIGERMIMAISYLLLIPVFIGYGVLHHGHMLYALYFCDNLLYISAICLTSYINRITVKSDLVPNLTMGVTTNHIGAVMVPIVGGFLWLKFGYPIVFYLGAAIVVASLVCAAKMVRKGAVV